MAKTKKIVSFLLTVSLVFSMIAGLVQTVDAIAFNEVDGPHLAGDLTGYIYGDCITEGKAPEPFGDTDPWSRFEWLENGGDTIIASYSGLKISTDDIYEMTKTSGSPIDLRGWGEYLYTGSADTRSGMDGVASALVMGTTDDVRIYFFNLTDSDVDVSFSISSTSKMGFGDHSVTSVVTPEGTTPLDYVEDDGENYIEYYQQSADLSFTLSPYVGDDNPYPSPEAYEGDNGSVASKRPADPEDGKSPAGCFYISLISQPDIGDSAAGFIISNFYASGSSDVETTITLQAPDHGSYTATGVIQNPEGEGTITVTETVTAGGDDKTFTYLQSNGLNLFAVGDSDYEFDFWSKSKGLLLSYESQLATRSYSEGDTVVANYLSKSQTRAFEVNSTRYISWVEAVQASQSEGSPVILKKDYTFASTVSELTIKGDTLEDGIIENNNGHLHYIIPSDVMFLIPFYDQDEGVFTEGPTFSMADPGDPYRILTIPDDVTFSVYGKMNVNAAAFASDRMPYTGGASGDYGLIDLSGTLNVENGGEIRTFGYIAGEGKVNIKSGAISYEVLQITDWGGGGNADWWNKQQHQNLEKSFYFSQYYVQNVEADCRVYKGAMVYVFGHISVSLGGISVNVNVPAGFIGEGDTLFTLSNGYIERRYDGDNDRIVYDIHGDMIAKSITVDVLGVATVASAEWLLGLTSNMDIIASEGTTILSNGYMVLPDTRVIVEEGAKVKINEDAKVYIWRLDDWKAGYVGNRYDYNNDKLFVPIRYTVANGTDIVRTNLTHSGTLIVNGEVEAYSNVFTTNDGGIADDMVIRGTGKLINNPGTVTSDLYILQNSKSFKQIQTLPILSYMYGETDVSSFDIGTYYSKTPAEDIRGNGTYDSWYQWKVEYTLTDENGRTFNYTDYAYNSDIDLNGELIDDNVRYIITGVDSITDTEGNDISSGITWNGNVTYGGVAKNINENITDGWEAIQFQGLNKNIKVSLHVESYHYRVHWYDQLQNGTTVESAEYITGTIAEKYWGQAYSVTAVVTPANGATANVSVTPTSTTLSVTGINEDIEVNITALTDRHPVTIQLIYPDSSTTSFNVDSMQYGDTWKAFYDIEKPVDGYYIIDTVSITNGIGVGYENKKDSIVLNGIVTDNVLVKLSLIHKDYKVIYNVDLTNSVDEVTIPTDFINAGEDITISNNDIVGNVGDKYVFGTATIATDGTSTILTGTPTNLTLTGIDKDLEITVPVIYYDYVITADGQTKYAVSGGSAEFTFAAGYAINDAAIGNNQIAAVSYVNPVTMDGIATLTVSGIESDVTVTLEKVRIDAIITFKDSNNNVLAVKYFETGKTVTYTAVDEGVGGNRYIISGSESPEVDFSNTETTVTVTGITGSAADVILTLTPFTYKVTWNDGVEITHTYLTGAENSATYYPTDNGVGNIRYFILTGYGEHISGATNSYSLTNGKDHYTVDSINADETVTLTLATYTYKVVFTNQNDDVIKIQYTDATDHDVTISTDDNTIRYDVAGADLISSKHTIITTCEITGTAVANNGDDFGEGVERVTLTGIASDVTAKLEIYEYDHKVITVVNDINGWHAITENHYIIGDSYSWTRPIGEIYEVDSVSSTHGTATKDSITEVSLDLTGISIVEIELDITTKFTTERLHEDLRNFTLHTTANGLEIGVTVIDSSYGIFTVECVGACVILVNNKDGTYSRLDAVPTGEANKYEFSCPNNFSEAISIEIAIKGDVNGDGVFDIFDQSFIGRGLLETNHRRYLPFTGLTWYIADVNGDGLFDLFDQSRLGRALLETTHRRYLPLRWVINDKN